MTGVAFSPDGAMVAGADADGTIVPVEPGHRCCIGPPLQAGSGVNGVAFSPDGTLLASADADGGVSLWNGATGQVSGPVPASRLRCLWAA